MKQRHIQILLVILISGLVLISPAFLHYSDLLDMDLFSTELNFENPDPDDQFDGEQHESDAFMANIFSMPSLAETCLFQSPLYRFYQVIPINQETPILRC